MLNETDNGCGKSVTVSASNAVLNSSASSVCVSVKQRSSGADYCRGRCKSRALVAQTAGIVGFMVRNIAHCKITPTQSACIAQMVGTLKLQCSTVPSHCLAFRTSCCRISAPLDCFVAHAASMVLQSAATLKESGRAEELQIRLVRFDSGPRLQKLPRNRISFRTHHRREPRMLPGIGRLLLAPAAALCQVLGCKILRVCPSGEIGRHIGLKIRRFQKWGVPVRFRSRAPHGIQRVS